ncbi:MAG: mechanosensitive ion channel family protein [Archaeoglobi archaeon]|jgi:small-conductance mechanosensitive channel|nr:mechanosensitive ion channel family protein [Archaeoglobus sp.]TDA27893.1 MAG: mechanosensitive ion channel family protein [Archaeoglobi archaeon]TDA28992.1 MAG: mechanosensitive ion channel family protein [Archaeoglobi archaeon]
MSEKDTIGSALTRLVVYVIVAVIILGILNWIFHYFIPETVARYPSLRSLAMISDFAPYIFIIVSLAIGWMIISSIASLLYAMSEPKYGASTAAAIRSLVKILGLGGLFASVAGGVAGGATGVALGGFIGLVVGFATQQVLGQAVAGLFILLARPFKIGDNVDIAGESDVIIKDIGTMFTVVERKDSNTVLIPSTMIIGQKIVIRRKSQ